MSGLLRLQLSQRKPARLVAAGLLVAAVMGQVGGAAHLALVQHVECAEHGELVEVTADSQHELAPDESVTHVHADATAFGEHDHCWVAAFRRVRVRTQPVRPALVHALTASASFIEPLFAAPPPTIALLDLAPKNSPPSV